MRRVGRRQAGKQEQWPSRTGKVGKVAGSAELRDPCVPVYKPDFGAPFWF